MKKFLVNFQDAGIWILNSENYTYTSELDFATEEFTLATFIPIPSIPLTIQIVEHGSSQTMKMI